MCHALVYIIKVYQKLSKYKPRTCRFEPTCSEYAAQAILRYGPIKGIGLAVRRLLRCNPWCTGGADPVT